MGERVEVRGRQRNEKGRRERRRKKEGVVWVEDRKRRMNVQQDSARSVLSYRRATMSIMTY